MRFILSALCLTGMLFAASGCGSDEPSSTDTSVADILATTDTPTVLDTATTDDTGAVPPVDTSVPEDTAEPVDTMMSEDTALPADTSVPQDTAVADTMVPEDTTPVADTSVPEDTAVPPEDIAAEDTASEDTVPVSECSEIKVNKSLALMSGEKEFTFTYDNNGTDSDRTIVVYVPNNLKPGEKLPLVFLFHGSGGGTKGMVNMCKKANNSGKRVLCVVPQGANQIQSGKPGWNLSNEETGEDDLTFVRTLWATLKSNPLVDKDHVYALGSSMGSAFSANILAASACTPFLSGVYLSASQMWKGTEIKRTGPFGIIIAHGTEDKLIPAQGGMAFGKYDFLSVEDSLKLWAEYYGCGEDAETKDSDDLKKVVYPGCDRPMVAYLLKGQAHGVNVSDLMNGGGPVDLIYQVFVEGSIP